jgi:polysaccharide pyruvyl transferase CsaB
MGRGSVAPNPLNVPLLAGYFGFGNAGDEMILHLLQHRFGPAPFLSGPRPSQGSPVSRFHVLEIFRQLRRSRALLLGGGELFQSRTSVRSLVYYLMLPLLARALKRPVLGFSLALDPDLGPLGRWVTAAVLRHAIALWVRDDTSRRFLERAGLSPRVMPDVAWAWPAPKIPPPTALRRIAWIPRMASLPDAGTALGNTFQSLPADLQHGIIPFDPFEDGPALADLKKRFPVFPPVETWSTVHDVFDRLSRYDLVVTMRYHGLVAAALAGRPVIAIPSHRKVADLACALRVPTVEPGSVASTDWVRLFRRTFDSGAPTPGDRPARAAAALDQIARVFADIPLHN